jgi:hypothetical protein
MTSAKPFSSTPASSRAHGMTKPGAGAHHRSRSSVIETIAS